MINRFLKNELYPPESEPIQPAPVQSVPVSAPTPQTPTAPQTQPSAQQNQTSFIRALLAKANAKLGSNRQKKLDKVMLLGTKERIYHQRTSSRPFALLRCYSNQISIKTCTARKIEPHGWFTLGEISFCALNLAAQMVKSLADQMVDLSRKDF